MKGGGGGDRATWLLGTRSQGNPSSMGVASLGLRWLAGVVVMEVLHPAPL